MIQITPGFEPGNQWSEVECSTDRQSARRSVSIRPTLITTTKTLEQYKTESKEDPRMPNKYAKCVKCTKSIEDEIHFVIQCIRAKYICIFRRVKSFSANSVEYDK